MDNSDAAAIDMALLAELGAATFVALLLGFLLFGGGYNLVKETEDAGQMLYDFGEADDGNFVGVDDEVASGPRHVVPADAEEVRLVLGFEAAEGVNELRAVEFARGFARRDEKSH